MSRIFLWLLGLLIAFVLGWAGGRFSAQPSRAPESAAVAASSARPTVPPDMPVPTAPVPVTPQEPDPQPAASDFPHILDTLRTGTLEAPGLLSSALTAENLPAALARAGKRVRFSRQPTQVPGSGKTVLELLPGSIAYWRPKSLSAAESSRLLKEWTVWRASRPTGLIVDLRFTSDPNDFSGAAVVGSLFATPGKTLFSLQSLHQPQQIFRSERQPMELPRWMPVLVLTHEHTRGAGEALAALLSAQASALRVGRPTAGEAGLYRESRLPSGLYLRVATARAVLEDGTELLGSPLEPDILVETDPALEKQAWEAAARQSAASVLAEPPPLPRVQEEYGPEQAAKEAPSKPLADSILKAAVDAITALQLRPIVTESADSTK